MRNFHRILQNCNVAKLLHEIVRHEELWNQNRFRTTFEGTPHSEVDDILLHYPPMIEGQPIAESDTACVWHPAALALPEAVNLALGLMQIVQAYSLERLLVSRLRPGAIIAPHADNQGSYVHFGDIARYHLVLQGSPGSLYHCDGETVQMLTGEAWWFNAHKMHAVENNSAEDRLHLLIDLRLADMIKPLAVA